MFKKLVKEILTIEDYNEAYSKVDMAFQREKISWDDHQTLMQLCDTIFD